MLFYGFPTHLLPLPTSSQPVVWKKISTPEFHTSISTPDFQPVDRCGNVRCTMPISAPTESFPKIFEALPGFFWPGIAFFSQVIYYISHMTGSHFLSRKLNQRNSLYGNVDNVGNVGDENHSSEKSYYDQGPR